MPVSPARTAAFEILLRVEQTNAYASDLLHSRKYAKLAPADRSLCTELVMGVLRWRSVLDQAIASVSKQRLEKLDLEVLVATRLAAYQLGWLDRVPARAAIYESVELVKHSGKRSAAPFVNALLRKLASASAALRPATPKDEDPQAVARAHAHPEWLVERWYREFGAKAAAAICRHNQQVPVTAIRLRDPAVEDELRRSGIQLAPGKLLTNARLVRSGDVTRTVAYRDGRIVIQDEASQLVALLVGRGQRLLDCCAAPGGKTATMADRNPDSSLLAVDLHPHRARLLRRLVRAPNVRVVAADAERLPTDGNFDRILADVPCSGTGTLARNPEIKWRLRPEDLSDLHVRQVAILLSALEQLEPRGRLVYSTCSLEREENQEVVEQVLATKPELQLLSCRVELEQLRQNGELAWQQLESISEDPFLRTVPGVHPVDGFFAAMITKS
jgi:16S rRNA (cytosine967-C5)-methyltransferase